MRVDFIHYNSRLYAPTYNLVAHERGLLMIHQLVQELKLNGILDVKEGKHDGDRVTRR